MTKKEMPQSDGKQRIEEFVTKKEQQQQRNHIFQVDFYKSDGQGKKKEITCF